MRGWKRCFQVMLSLCLLGVSAAPVRAAEPYTYTVRIFAGQMGTYEGKEVVIYENLPSGSTIDFHMNRAFVANDSKYYVKGIRESGKDSNTSTISLSSITVTKDMDFVISYGILGDKTSYTIEYVDRNGRELAPSETYYGNVGDKPVIAYLYIDGYQPQAYNLTKTLVKDSSENRFQFVYRPEEALGGGTTQTGTAPGGTQEVTVTDLGTTVEGTAPALTGGAALGTEAAGGGAAAGGDAAALGEADGEETEVSDVPDEETPLSEEPQTVRDLDEELPMSDTPFGTDNIENRNFFGIPMSAVWISGLVILGAGIWGIWLIRKRKKKGKTS